MCSICGGNYPLEVIQKASESMQHRGQDFSGSFSDKDFSFAHNRLSIIDLDSAANQPFTSPYCPHLVLVFNGEIYNYLEIKQELEGLGIPFFTHSDTEVLLHSFATWQEEALKRFNGDFAFAIYDKRDSSLFLARDRLGNKPLFYALEGDKIFFASEIKAFLAVRDFPFDLEEVSKWLLFSNGEPTKTIYQGIFNFPQAHFACFKEGKLSFRRYWDLEVVCDKTSLDDALEELESLLVDSLRLRLRSDVPVALSVSGGVDSSILAHLAHKISGNCQFFGIGFAGFKESDESAHIKQLEQDLKREIALISPTLDSIQRDFQSLLKAQDEIFRSLSQYAQFLLFKAMSPYCKVVLGGQGADELFGGYYHHIGRYIFADRKEFENRIRVYGRSALGEYGFGLKCSLEEELKLKIFAEDNAQNIEKLRQNFLPIPSMRNLLERFLSDFNQGLWLDVVRFNLPNLLRYEDRNAMAHSMENRTPFTDFRVVEFAFKIDKTLKFQKGYSKFILRKLLERLGSPKLAWRLDKIGFGVPEEMLMRQLGYNCTTIFDARWIIFSALKGYR